MKNIFILFIPAGNHEALVHYEDTIKNKVSPERIYRYLENELKNELRDIFGDKPITVWGSRDNIQNRSKYDRMQSGDDILIGYPAGCDPTSTQDLPHLPSGKPAV